MQVGDLVRWGDANGNYELGIVIELATGMIEDRVFVYFAEDNGASFISIDELEVICESR